MPEEWVKSEFMNTQTCELLCEECGYGNVWNMDIMLKGEKPRCSRCGGKTYWGSSHP
jgi:uncharacterized paraquat-inducible protein A